MWTLHQVTYDFESGDYPQGDMTNEEYTVITNNWDKMDYFFVGSDLTVTSIALVMADVNFL